MKFKIILVILLIIILLGFLTYKKETIQIYKSELSYNFGTKNREDTNSISHTFRFINNDKNTLKVIKLKSSDSCIRVDKIIFPKEISINETLKLKVKYNTQYCNEIGFINKIISLKFNNPVNNKDSLHHFYFMGIIEE